MSLREFLALGTGSQVPTRQRNHNGYFLRWDDEGFLFDPGEGTQRQMAFGDLPASAVHRIFITHFHGDHCLGLAGIIQRLSLDRVAHPVFVHYPASGQVYFDRLRHASIYHPAVELVPAPIEVPDDGLAVIAETPAYTVMAHALDHGVPTLGYRLVERDGRRFLPDRLAALGVRGPAVKSLGDNGFVRVGDRDVTLDEVSVARPGSRVAFVMDTRRCDGALRLAEDADLLEFGAQSLSAASTEVPIIASVLDRFMQQRLLAHALASHPFFSVFDPDQRHALAARFSPLTLAPGDALVREGSTETGIVLILAGEVDVTRLRDGATVHEGVIRNWWRQGMMGSALAHYHGIKAFSETDQTEDLRAISVPTLVLHGEDDQIVPIDASGRKSVTLLRNGTLKTYPGLPHGMLTTHAETLNADLLAFVKA